MSFAQVADGAELEKVLVQGARPRNGRQSFLFSQVLLTQVDGFKCFFLQNWISTVRVHTCLIPFPSVSIQKRDIKPLLCVHCCPSGSVSASSSLLQAPPRPPGHSGPAGGLPGGHCWLTDNPVNLCKPALACRRLSCFPAPAAEQSHSPVWPLGSDSVSGGKWLCLCRQNIHRVSL